MTFYVRHPYLAVTFAGQPVTNVFRAPQTFSVKQRVATAEVTVDAMPATGTYRDLCQIVCGASEGAARETFEGELVRRQFQFYPRRLTLSFKGRLYRAQKYRLPRDENGADEGLWLEDLLGASTGTDEEIVRAVLTRAGVAFDPADILGTGRVLGALGDDAYVWRWDQPALDYIAKLDEVSAVYTDATSPAGFYQTFEVPGRVVRALIGRRPRDTEDATYTEGVNIKRGATAERGIEGLYDAVRVTGYSFGPDDTVEFYLPGSNDFSVEGQPEVYPFASPLIETEEHAEVVAQALMLEVNNEAVTASLSTPEQDDVGPGGTILVQAPGGAVDRLGTGEKLAVEDLRLDPWPVYMQHYAAKGGGLPDGDPYLPEVPWL
jgi:hypothetical protein